MDSRHINIKVQMPEEVTDEYYIPEKDDYTWWWYDYCKYYQRIIDDTDEICIQYTED